MVTISSVVTVVVAAVMGRRADSVRSAVGADKARSFIMFFHDAVGSWMVSGVVEREGKEKKRKMAWLEHKENALVMRTCLHLLH